jgi:hypothetical protein
MGYSVILPVSATLSEGFIDGSLESITGFGPSGGVQVLLIDTPFYEQTAGVTSDLLGASWGYSYTWFRGYVPSFSSSW